jgi:hypothetical protein
MLGEGGNSFYVLIDDKKTETLTKQGVVYGSARI